MECITLMSNRIQKPAKTKKQQWLESYLSCGDPLKSVDLAGYNYGSKAAQAVIACRNKKELSAEIQEHTLQQIATIGPQAIESLTDMMINSTQDSVRVTAAKALASYAGLDIQRTEDITRQDTRTDEQLIDSILSDESIVNALKAKLANKAKVIKLVKNA